MGNDPRPAATDPWEQLRTRVRLGLVGQPLPLIRVADRACPASSLYAGGRALAVELERERVRLGTCVAVTTGDPLELAVALLAAVRLGASLLVAGRTSTGHHACRTHTSAVTEIASGDGLMPFVCTPRSEDAQRTQAIDLASRHHQQPGECWNDPTTMLVAADAFIARHRLTGGMRVVAAFVHERPDRTLTLLLPALLASVELVAAPNHQLDEVAAVERPDLILRDL